MKDSHTTREGCGGALMEVQTPLGAGHWLCRAQTLYPNCQRLNLASVPLELCDFEPLPNLSVPQFLVYTIGIVILKYLLLVVMVRIK